MKSSAELIQAAKELFGLDYEITNAVVMHEMKTADYFKKPYAEMFGTGNVLVKHKFNRAVVFAIEDDPDTEIVVDDPNGYLTEGLETILTDDESEAVE
jgi:hypothetical protein